MNPVPIHLTYRRATLNDCPVLAQLNRQLIEDEGHRNRLTVPELEERMQGWLSSDYSAVLFQEAQETVGYALYREQPDEIHLRQLFVVRARRRQGIGRQAVGLLRSKLWPSHKRLTVEVLVGNTGAIVFWRTIGYRDYCLTLEIMPETTGGPCRAPQPPESETCGNTI